MGGEADLRGRAFAGNGKLPERKSGARYRSPPFRQRDVSFPRAREAARMLCFFHDFQIKVILWRSSVI
ncbi:hypothetical protein B4135_1865 [Caldibacillus debilis]|uniref:Uncharacterized protein n=1 Tax=Caldibacillus debilis TaxID=301148 RepID=A0A150M7G4_9BACI|nr:hypothetical protein B4135_1865 [Caldibacillus debilis]